MEVLTAILTKKKQIFLTDQNLLKNFRLIFFMSMFQKKPPSPSLSRIFHFSGIVDFAKRLCHFCILALTGQPTKNLLFGTWQVGTWRILVPQMDNSVVSNSILARKITLSARQNFSIYDKS